jgi:hypothetical protein
MITYIVISAININAHISKTLAEIVLSNEVIIQNFTSQTVSRFTQLIDLLVVCVLITIGGVIIPYLSISVWARLATWGKGAG